MGGGEIPKGGAIFLGDSSPWGAIFILRISPPFERGAESPGGRISCDTGTAAPPKKSKKMVGIAERVKY